MRNELPCFMGEKKARRQIIKVYLGPLGLNDP